MPALYFSVVPAGSVVDVRTPPARLNGIRSSYFTPRFGHNTPKRCSPTMVVFSQKQGQKNHLLCADMRWFAQVAAQVRVARPVQVTFYFCHSGKLHCTLLQMTTMTINTSHECFSCVTLVPTIWRHSTYCPCWL